jgi:hypothetical protein
MKGDLPLCSALISRDKKCFLYDALLVRLDKFASKQDPNCNFSSSFSFGPAKRGLSKILAQNYEGRRFSEFGFSGSISLQSVLRFFPISVVFSPS